jgi:CHAD domain-containing protein
MADGKWIEGLKPDIPVVVAAREVLVARFQVVRQYLPLAVEKSFEDPEYVHQLRVGTRRATAALRVFADCLPPKHLKAARRSLKKIRQAAGDARDWDVFILGLPETKPLKVAAGKPALDFLIGYAVGEREAAQVGLRDAVKSNESRFEEESEHLPEAVHDPKTSEAPTTFGDLAASQLSQLMSDLNTAIEANPNTPSELHQLRILGKHVRYALEIFVDCFPAVFKESVYESVEQVQELLGSIQDATVGLERLSIVRDHIKRLIPGEWYRLQKGFDGMMRTLRAKLPTGRRSLQKWRKDWVELVANLKMETVAATVIA